MVAAVYSAPSKEPHLNEGLKMPNANLETRVLLSRLVLKWMQLGSLVRTIQPHSRVFYKQATSGVSEIQPQSPYFSIKVQ